MIQRIYPPTPSFQPTYATQDLALQSVPDERWVIYFDPELALFGIYKQSELDTRGAWIRRDMIVLTSEDRNETDPIRPEWTGANDQAPIR